MNFSELGRVIEALGKDRGIEKDIVVKAIEQAFLVTARRNSVSKGNMKHAIMRTMMILRFINIKTLFLKMTLEMI